MLHAGPSLAGGHCTAIVFSAGGWQHCDDRTVRGITEAEALMLSSQRGYLLFYGRQP